jgi:hypothetical protein
MAESDTQNTRRLTDWIILIFVLVVMGLLIADLGSNLEGELDRGNRPDGTTPANAEYPDSPVPLP